MADSYETLKDEVKAASSDAGGRTALSSDCTEAVATGTMAAAQDALADEPQCSISHEYGDAQSGHAGWTIVTSEAAETKHACTGATHTSTKAKMMPVANIRRCFSRALFTLPVPKNHA